MEFINFAEILKERLNFENTTSYSHRDQKFRENPIKFSACLSR